VDFYFLLFSLFVPRIVLLAYFLLFPQLYPANMVPQWADILLGILFPRVLILIYIYQNMGYDNLVRRPSDRCDPGISGWRARNSPQTPRPRGIGPSATYMVYRMYLKKCGLSSGNSSRFYFQIGASCRPRGVEGKRRIIKGRAMCQRTNSSAFV